jgi:undecaprenyl-diphosphatase
MKLKDYPRSSLTLFAGLALAAGALVLFSWLAEEVFEGDARQFDEWVRAAVNAHATPTLTTAMRGVTYLGSTAFILCASVVVAVVFYFMKWRRAAALLLITMVGAFVLNTVLKLSFHRSRPDPFFGITAPDSFSFPSGHTLYSFCLFGTLAVIIISSRVRGVAARVAAWSAATVLVFLVGLSRVYLGVHYPTDVVASYLAASVWVLAVAIGDRLSHRDERAAKR